MIRVGLALVLAALGLVVGCGDTIVNYPNVPTPVAPPTDPVVTSTVEFRISGNPSSVRARYSNERDGLIQTVTTLPFFTTFATTQSSLFLSLDVTPIAYPMLISYPFLSAQIFVNHDLFREATSNEFALNTISVGGTWRR